MLMAFRNDSETMIAAVIVNKSDSTVVPSDNKRLTDVQMSAQSHATRTNLVVKDVSKNSWPPSRARRGLSMRHTNAATRNIESVAIILICFSLTDETKHLGDARANAW
jgi:hypothetical protein